MADNTVLNLGAGGDTIATDDIGGVKHELVKVEYGADGVATMVDAANPFPVTDAAAAVSLASIDLKTGGASSGSAVTSVADSATNVTLLASNAARLGATVYNDSTEILYLKLGATASLTSFTSRLIPNAYYEIPFRYKGIIDGIWANNSTGNARITELT